MIKSQTRKTFAEHSLVLIFSIFKFKYILSKLYNYNYKLL